MSLRARYIVSERHATSLRDDPHLWKTIQRCHHIFQILSKSLQIYIFNINSTDYVHEPNSSPESRASFRASDSSLTVSTIKPPCEQSLAGLEEGAGCPGRYRRLCSPSFVYAPLRPLGCPLNDNVAHFQPRASAGGTPRLGPMDPMGVAGRLRELRVWEAASWVVMVMAVLQVSRQVAMHFERQGC
jgi:hypothetical protein